MKPKLTATELFNWTWGSCTHEPRRQWFRNLIESSTFTLMDIPLAVFDHIGLSKSMHPPRLSGSPIVVDVRKCKEGVFILDGCHRWAEAKREGKETIKAYVGSKALKLMAIQS